MGWPRSGLPAVCACAAASTQASCFRTAVHLIPPSLPTMLWLGRVGLGDSGSSEAPFPFSAQFRPWTLQKHIILDTARQLKLQQGAFHSVEQTPVTLRQTCSSLAVDAPPPAPGQLISMLREASLAGFPCVRLLLGRSIENGDNEENTSLGGKWTGSLNGDIGD